MKLHLRTRKDLPRELERLFPQGKGAEIGVLKGEFSKEILSHWSGKLYLIDSWRHTDGLRDTNNGDPNIQLYNFSEAFKNTYSFADRASIIREPSVDAAKLFPDESLNFVYIDANHDYKNVLADLLAWIPKVRNGGLVIGDDYTTGTWGDATIKGQAGWTDFEVKEAVDDYVQLTGIKLHLTDEPKPQWWFFKE